MGKVPHKRSGIREQDKSISHFLTGGNPQEVCVDYKKKVLSGNWGCQLGLLHVMLPDKHLVEGYFSDVCWCFGFMGWLVVHGVGFDVRDYCEAGMRRATVQARIERSSQYWFMS